MADEDLRGIAHGEAGRAPRPPHADSVRDCLFVATLASDVAYVTTADTFWARGSFWLLAAALVMSAAALAGFADFLGSARIRSVSDA